ncbi:MAG TPA: M20 family metallopeptidase [Bryobacteraceae bacterium]|nr:M20 family metallopeptidase [Bryobacteraceae bacterium]
MFLRELVECESPSDDPAALVRFADLFAARVADIAAPRRAGNHLVCDFEWTGGEGQILALGHMDTVWPLGTLRGMPWQEAGGRLHGPGIFDMKAGLAFFVFAMRALRELHVPLRRRVVLQINSDEEVGSESSRPLTEQNARAAVAVLVLEPAAGLDGKLKTARKGVGDYTVRVTGRAAHAGLDFSSGASAIVELARQITAISEFTDLARGITVNPGVISGGTRTNVIAPEARVEVDMRVARAEDAAELDHKFRSLAPVDKRCSIEITGGLNRPPLERTEAVANLFAHAQKLARDLGVELGETSVGGGSDGNFTAPLAPTLDGLGAVGDGAHAAHEHILIDRIADRVALLAKLVATL